MEQQEDNADTLFPDAQQAELEEILCELAKRELDSEEDIHSYSERLASVYSDGIFRHSYSRVFCAIYAPGEMNSNMSSSFDPLRDVRAAITAGAALYSNLRTIYARLKEGECNERILLCVEKLSDHVNLDFQRNDYVFKQMERILGRLAKSEGSISTRLCDLDDKTEKVEQKTEQAEKKAEDIEKRLDRSQREYIAILGVFAAVVVAFSAGVNFAITSTGVVANSNIVNIVLIVAVVGLFLFDILFVLFTFIYRMVRQNGTNWGILSNKKFYIFNGVVLVAIVILFICSMVFGVIENPQLVDNLLSLISPE